MKKQVRHIIPETLEKIDRPNATHPWKVDYLFFDGRKWRQDQMYFVHKPEFDRPHRLFKNDCARIKKR